MESVRPWLTLGQALLDWVSRLAEGHVGNRIDVRLR
jgi:hypothetical protein